MSLDKAIAAGEEHRRTFEFKHKKDRAKSVDRTCRNHGSCPRCEGTRKYADRKQRTAADDKIRAWQRGEAEDED